MTDTRTDEVPASEIDEAFVPRPRPLVAQVELDHELVVAVARPGTHQFDAHWLDPAASVVWASFDGATDLGHLIDELSAAFGADRDVVRADVLALARTLGRSGLLEGVAFDPPRPPVPVRPEALPIGTPIPAFSLRDLDGQVVTSDETRGRRHIFVNWSPTCGFCVQIASDLAALLPELRAGGADLLLVASGSVADNSRVVEGAGLDCTVLRCDDYKLFAGLGTPSAYVVDADGTIGSGLVIGANEVPGLVRRLVPGP